MKLYFLRHGIAEDRRLGISDFERALVPIGVDKTKRLAKRLGEYDINPTVIYTSPRLRAKQTAEIIAEYNGIHLEVTDKLDFDFDERAMQSLVDQHTETDDIMVVGHEPSFSSTVSYIIGGGNITMKKGGVARIDLFSKHPLHGTLVWLLSPKVLG